MNKQSDILYAEAPATVANVGCGFDVLGFALQLPNDQVGVRFNSEKTVRLMEIQGDGGRLPKTVDKNVAGFVIQQFLKSIGETQGIDVYLKKGIPLSSGLGGSAASSVAAVVAVNALFKEPLNKNDLLALAVKGEELASGAGHADNVAPSLMGGFTLIADAKNLDVKALPVPEDMICIVVHPELEIKTKDARDVLPKNIPLTSAVQQSGNLAAFISALYSKDFENIENYLQDIIVEPARQSLLTGFQDVKMAALQSGAFACSISGAGPSVFALTCSNKDAGSIAYSMCDAFAKHNIASTSYTSKINTLGAKLI